MSVVEIKKGSELTRDEVGLLNAWRKKEFNSIALFGVLESKTYFNDVFFLNKENDKLVAFGRLRALSVYIGDKKYDIWGIAMIAAIEKFKGYGKQLMKSIRAYISVNPKTTIGFCSTNVSEFYKKCGFSILTGGQKYFVHIDEHDQKHYEDEDVLYLEGKDDLISQLLSEHTITHYMPHW